MEDYTKDMRDEEEDIIHISKVLKEDDPHKQSASRTFEEEWTFMEGILNTPPSHKEPQKEKTTEEEVIQEPLKEIVVENTVEEETK